MRIFGQEPTENEIRENRLFLGFIGPDRLREIIGIFGMLLPIFLFVGNDFTIQSSISGYYHTNMKPWFIFYFLLLGYILIAYRGFPESTDDEASVLAGISSIIIAVVRVTPPGSPSRDLLGWIHVIFTIIFFIVLTYMSWSLFTLNPEHKWKKNIYKFSAIVMASCMVAIMVFDFLELPSFQNSTYWFEVVAFEFFGISWFVKGL